MSIHVSRLDDEAYVVYLDMLGFSALTEAHPQRRIAKTIDTDDEERTMDVIADSPAASTFDKFHAVLNDALALFATADSQPLRTMVFSDCAFLVFKDAVKAAMAAARLMRRFLAQEVPVRMGVAFGTCNLIRFSSEHDEYQVVLRAVSSGTAIVRAVQAEKAGGKGCRIFVHVSLTESDLDRVDEWLRVLSLPQPLTAISSELCYLYHHDHAAPDRDGTALQGDETIRKAIESMSLYAALSADSVEVNIQYSETVAALNRMRVAMHRPEFAEMLSSRLTRTPTP